LGTYLVEMANGTTPSCVRLVPSLFNGYGMPLQDYPYWELKPRKMNREEMENPMLVIHDFFSYSHLPAIREQLWELLRTTVSGNFCKSLTRRERSDMLFFYEKLEKVIEAIHVLSVQNPQVKGD
jgi:hypothetical protein